VDAPLVGDLVVDRVEADLAAIALPVRRRSEWAEGRLLITLDVLFERPIPNIRQLEAALEVPYRAAQWYVERLVEIGMLRGVTRQPPNPIHRTDGIVDALEDSSLGSDKSLDLSLKVVIASASEAISSQFDEIATAWQKTPGFAMTYVICDIRSFLRRPIIKLAMQ
jgi:hypothetical protein